MSNYPISNIFIIGGNHRHNEINPTLNFLEERVHMYTTLDRRVKRRIECDYLAVVEGVNGNGKKYQDQAKLVNLSVTGSYNAGSS